MCQVVREECDLTNKKCLISHRQLDKHLDDLDVIKLSCGHCFHRASFITSFLINNKNLFSYRECPYCKKYISKVPLIIKKRT